MTFKPSGKFPLKLPYHVWVSLEARRLRTFDVQRLAQISDRFWFNPTSTFNVQHSTFTPDDPRGDVASVKTTTF